MALSFLANGVSFTFLNKPTYLNSPITRMKNIRAITVINQLRQCNGIPKNGLGPVFHAKPANKNNPAATVNVGITPGIVTGFESPALVGITAVLPQRPPIAQYTWSEPKAKKIKVSSMAGIRIIPQIYQCITHRNAARDQYYRV